MIHALRARAGRHRLLLRLISPLLAIGIIPAVTHAAPTCERAPGAASRDARAWPSPLDRLVTLHSRDLALGDALNRLAAAARLRLSYSAELVTLDRRVCVSYDSVAAGTVLSDLLDGSMVSPVVAGDDQVVLAPAPTQRWPGGTRAARSASVSVLDRVLVTGTATGAAAHAIASSTEVIDRDQLAKQKGGTLSETLNGVVPGLWVWDQSPSSVIAQ